MGARKRHATLDSAGHSDDGADEFAVWHNLAGTASDRERILAAAVVEACQLEQRLQRRGAGQHWPGVPGRQQGLGRLTAAPTGPVGLCPYV